MCAHDKNLLNDTSSLKNIYFAQNYIILLSDLKSLFVVAKIQIT